MRVAILIFLAFISAFCLEVKSFKTTTNSVNIPNESVIFVVAELLTDGNVSGEIPQFPTSEDYSVLSSNRSQSSSRTVSIVNGKVTNENNVVTRYSYQIRINTKKTAVTLPPLSINIGGNSFSSNAITFNIGEKLEANHPVSISFLRDRSTVYKGEQSRMTVRVAVRAGTNAQLTTEGYNAFLSSFVDKLSANFTVTQLSKNIDSRVEVINGINHQIYDLPLNLVPLDTGRVAIPQIPVTYIVQDRDRGRDPFDIGFFGFSSVRQRQDVASSPALVYTIRDLPRPAPKGFTGIIGEIRLSGNVSSDSVEAGDAVTLRITMNGRMSAAVMGEIELEKNSDLDIFPPERRVRQDTSAAGINSRKEYSWMIVPRKEGRFKIPSREVTWFDPASATYKVASTGDFFISAAKGDYSQQPTTRRYLTQSEIATLGDDIRFIKMNYSTSDIHENPQNIRNIAYMLTALIAACVIMVLIKIKILLFPRNLHEERRSKAYTEAVRSLNKGKISEISALINYLSAKTSRECGSMRYDEIESLLAGRNVSEEVCKRLTGYLRQVEMSRYSSGGVTTDFAKSGIEILKSIDREIR